MTSLKPGLAPGERLEEVERISVKQRWQDRADRWEWRDGPRFAIAFAQVVADLLPGQAEMGKWFHENVSEEEIRAAVDDERKG